ncbi:MAG TPA: redoxin domain-containing protein [Ideonella sp.]|uniref:TlpA family protein disulfide reductase n=1 Tax=Ideonella sp. TaxID=1929293 RepID=UPI002CD3C3EB|nr:redoxin domain-containing protein [Ideonella sp.]HSI47146.1 redoxin domain-containing protein [Ideonella sp.]
MFHRRAVPFARLLGALLLATCLGSALASSPVAPPAGSPLLLQGMPLEAGPAFSLSSLRGQVVLVYYWHTGCAVCLDKLPELRANVTGWRNRPFTLVMVQVDHQREQAQRYWQVLMQAQPQARQGPVLWRDGPGFADNLHGEPQHWPLSVLVDTQGRVADSWEGRIPADAWDRIADLLP